MRHTTICSRNVSLIIILFLMIFMLFFRESAILAYYTPNTIHSSVSRPSSQSANLVINGNFESGNLDNWNVEDTVSAIQGQGYNTSYGAQINSWGRITQIVATTAGKKYDVTGWLQVNRQIRAPSWGGIRVQITDQNWQELGRSPFYSTASSQWIAVSFSFTASSSQTRIAFENFSDIGEFDATFDDAAILPSDSTTATSTATLPPTATPIATTANPPTATATSTASPPTATATSTAIPPTATATSTAILPTATPIVADSLIKNGNFEAGTLVNWETAGGISITSKAAFAGSYGAHMNETGRIDQTFSTTMGQSYSVRAKLRIEQQITAASWGGLQLSVVNASWQSIASSPYYTTSNAAINQWVDITFTFSASSSSARLIFQNFSNGKFVASIDEIIVSNASIATATPTKVIITTPTAPATATPTNLPILNTTLEGFESSPSTWLVASRLSGSSTLQQSTSLAADGRASALLSTSGSTARAQLQVSFSDSATAHSWEERPGTWYWQRVLVYVPTSTVTQLQSDQYFTLAGLYPSAGGPYGWQLRVKPNGQLTVFGYTANSSPAEFPAYASLPLNRWVSLELGLHSQAGPGVKRSFAFLLDGQFHGWYRQGNMSNETYNRAAVGILETNTNAPLQVFVDAWQQPGTSPLPTGPDARSSAALQTQDFRTQSGVQVQYDWSTWELQPILHAEYGLFSANNRIQAGRNLERMPELGNGWAEIEVDWPQGPPSMRTPQGYFGPMVGFRKEINREQNLEVIPIGNGKGAVDLALEAWVGTPVILARWPMPTASVGGTAIPEPGDIIRVRWEEISASTLAVRASYYDASAATWYTDIINGSYDLTAIGDGSTSVNFFDGAHTASSITIDSPAYAIRRYTVGTLATAP